MFLDKFEMSVEERMRDWNGMEWNICIFVGDGDIG